MDHLHMDHSNHENMGHAYLKDHEMHEKHRNGTHLMGALNDIFNASTDIIKMNDRSDLANHGSHDSNGAHGDHNGHEAHSTSGGHDMSMTFHGGYVEKILFSWWNVTEVGQFVGSFFAIFIMALLYEGLKYYRKHLLWKTYTGLQYCAVAPPDKGVSNICAPDEPQVIQPIPHVLERNVFGKVDARPTVPMWCSNQAMDALKKPRMLSTAHGWQTLLHGIQVLVSYMLMLVFMTYNVWLCAAVVLGSATGYFLFGWRESVVVDFTEHCH